jgi:acylphosphatase
MNERTAYRLLVIHGRVQGVGFRAFVQAEALRRGLEGFARNRRDGTVEALLAGDEATLDDMLIVVRTGPPGSRVQAVDVVPTSADALLQRLPGERFSILATA